MFRLRPSVAVLCIAVMLTVFGGTISSARAEATFVPITVIKSTGVTPVIGNTTLALAVVGAAAAVVAASAAVVQAAVAVVALTASSSSSSSSDSSSSSCFVAPPPAELFSAAQAREAFDH